MKIVCFFPNYFTQVNGEYLQIQTFYVKRKGNGHPGSCVLPIHVFFFSFDIQQIKANFFPPGRITHLWYLGDNIIFHLYILFNKNVFYTTVIVSQFEYLLPTENWRDLLPV